MNKAVAYLLLLVVLVPVHTVEADAIDGQTRETLEAIMAGYHGNRAQILDFSMSGSIVTIREEAETPKKMQVLYRYNELGEKKRIDTIYPGDADDPVLAGRTKIYALTGKNTLTYLSGAGPDKITAQVLRPGEFHRSSELTCLDSLELSGEWFSHVGHIKYLLSRGWDPHKESIRVEPVDHEGRVLLEVAYRSTRGGLTQHTWLFDPERGYEVVQARSFSTYLGGNPLRRVEASHHASEVAEGVWRVVDANYLIEQWDENGKKLIVRKELTSGKISANSGSVDRELFYFSGMGVEPGSLVVDHTFSPRFTYQFDVDPLHGLEDVLNEAYHSSRENVPEPNAIQEPPEPAKRTEPQNVPNKPPEQLHGPEEGDPKPESTSVLSRENSTMMWVLLLFVLSVFLGYIRLRKQTSGSGSQKTKLSILLVVSTSVLLCIGAKAPETSTADNPLLVDSELRLYHTEQNICGITSLYIALLEVGHEVSLADILGNVPIEARGSSLAAMSQYLAKCGIPHQIVRPSSLETVLKALKPGVSAAILHVDNGAHFLVVKKTNRNHVSIIDGGKVIQDGVIQELRRRFSGTAMFVGLTTRDMLANSCKLEVYILDGRNHSDWFWDRCVGGKVPFN